MGCTHSNASYELVVPTAGDTPGEVLPEGPRLPTLEERRQATRKRMLKLSTAVCNIARTAEEDQLNALIRLNANATQPALALVLAMTPMAKCIGVLDWILEQSAQLSADLERETRTNGDVEAALVALDNFEQLVRSAKLDPLLNSLRLAIEQARTIHAERFIPETQKQLGAIQRALNNETPFEVRLVAIEVQQKEVEQHFDSFRAVTWAWSSPTDHKMYHFAIAYPKWKATVRVSQVPK